MNNAHNTNNALIQDVIKAIVDGQYADPSNPPQIVTTEKGVHLEWRHLCSWVAILGDSVATTELVVRDIAVKEGRI